MCWGWLCMDFRLGEIVKVKIFTSLLVTYLINYTIYIVYVSKYKIERHLSSNWSFALIFLLLIAIFSFNDRGNIALARLLIMAKTVILVTILIIMLNNAFGIKNVYYLLSIFYMLNIAVSAIALDISNRPTTFK